MKYSSKFIDLLFDQYVSGKSLTFLSDFYLIPKSSLHYHFSTLRGVTRVFSVKKFKQYNEYYLGLFLGLWAGDGNIVKDKYSYTVRFFFNPNDLLAISLLLKSSRLLFGIVPSTSENRKNVISLRITSKFVFNLIKRKLFFSKLKSFSVCLKRPISSYSKPFLKGFIIGLALIDGSLRSKNFCFSSTSKSLAFQFRHILRQLGFDPGAYLQRRKEKTWKPIWRIWLRSSDSKKFKSTVLPAFSPVSS